MANEEELISLLRKKLGPWADETKLVYHIRNSRGKLHWAVNSYFREVLSLPEAAAEDFRHRPAVPSAAPQAAAGAEPVDAGLQAPSGSAQQQPDGAAGAHCRTSTGREPAGAGADAAQAEGAEAASRALDCLPLVILEHIFGFLDVPSLCHVSATCSACRRAGLTDGLWRALFQARWGDFVFPLQRRLTQHPAAVAAAAASSSSSSAQVPPPTRPLAAATTAAGEETGLAESVVAAASAASATAAGSSAHRGLPQGLEPEAASPPPAPQQRGPAAGAPPALQPTWRQCYRAQHGYQLQMRCPSCGAGALKPIVYGFPSPQLLQCMRSKRCVLGGDHLIEACHVWACTCAGCNVSFRHFPYDDVAVWAEEHARLALPTTAARAAAAAAAAALPHGHAHGAGGLPVPPSYTYEL